MEKSDFIFVCVPGEDWVGERASKTQVFSTLREVQKMIDEAKEDAGDFGANHYIMVMKFDKNHKKVEQETFYLGGE